MSSYTAVIRCKECGKVLAEINAYHEPKADWWVPQDFVTEEFGLSSIYCQDCLNGRSNTREDKNDNS